MKANKLLNYLTVLLSFSVLKQFLLVHKFAFLEKIVFKLLKLLY